MNFWTNKRVLVTGGAGFLGSHVVNALRERGVTDIIIPRSATCDLRLRENCHKVAQGVDIVIHLAAKVGGIEFNQRYPGEMVYDNTIMGIQLLEEARLANVSKFIVVGTACCYPDSPPVPFKEDDLWNGYPTEVTAPYGLAKRLLLTQSQAYHKQYGFNTVFLIPTNLFGPKDNFDSKSSHVIPALIKKVIDAKKSGEEQIVVWGTGKATREFLYVEDASEGILLAAERYNKPEPINLGTGIEVPIKELIELIVELSEFNGKIVWDRTKPDGQPRRCFDVSRAKEELGFEAKMSLQEGLKRTIDWYTQYGR